MALWDQPWQYWGQCGQTGLCLVSLATLKHPPPSSEFSVNFRRMSQSHRLTLTDEVKKGADSVNLLLSLDTEDYILKKAVFLFGSRMFEGLRNSAEDQVPSHIAGASNAEQRLNKNPAEVPHLICPAAQIRRCCLRAPLHVGPSRCHAPDVPHSCEISLQFMSD